MKTNIINFSDSVKKNLSDNLSVPNDIKLHGQVSTYYEDNNGNREHIFTKDNLIIYNGREFLRKAVQPIYIDGDLDMTVRKITHIGFGASDSISLETIVPSPDVQSMSLVHVSYTGSVPSNINIYTNYNSQSVDYQFNKKLIAVQCSAEADVENNNKQLISAFTVTLDDVIMNGQENLTQYNLNEAGLYVQDVSVVHGVKTYNNIQMFQHVYFPTIVKDANRKIVFVWRIFF